MRLCTEGRASGVKARAQVNVEAPPRQKYAKLS